MPPVIPVAPWLAEPYSLWSIDDMQRFYGPRFMASVGRFGRACGQLMERSFPYESAEVVGELRAALDDMEKGLLETPLSKPVRFQFESLKRQVNGEVGTLPGLTEREILLLAKTFHDSLLVELSSHVYLLIPSDRKRMFLKPADWYGEKAWLKFNGDAGEDMRDCAKCFALAQWTASVFHAMRVLEHGLRALADRVGNVTFPHPIELENWQGIIEKIDSEIRDKKNLPKGAAKNEETEFCSRAASHFWHFKDAWRNHVSHSRRTYNEDEARVVVEHVRDFMTALAA